MTTPLLLAGACRRAPTPAPDASPPVAATADVSADAAPVASPGSGQVALDDRCGKHDDCVTVDVYVDGPLRCCVACGSQAAASKASAEAFVAACAKAKPMRDCPILDCAAPPLDARCVGGRCMLAPRPR
ncbi:MAG: hypothetical protein HYV09_11185 [Deltaproteobacteria bacterium]|nr:hypothetical protein [Deltaproteobacteria bacterium]